MAKIPAPRYALEWTIPGGTGVLDDIRSTVCRFPAKERGTARRAFDTQLEVGAHWLRLGYRLRLVDLDAEFIAGPIDEGLEAFIAQQVDAFLAELEHDRQLATVDGAL